MTNTCAVIFIGLIICISEIGAVDIGDCRGTSQLTLNGFRDEEGLWNTSFTLAKLNATLNWTLLVQHSVIESAGKRLVELRGYMADGLQDAAIDGMRRIWTCDSFQLNGESKLASYKGLESKRDEVFQVIPLSKWSSIKKQKIIKNVRFWQTSSNCTEFVDCVESLLDVHEEQIKSSGRLKFNFNLVPGGKVLEDLGWDLIYGEEIIINFLTPKNNVYPSAQALAAFSRLLREGVSLGKLSSDHGCLHPSHTTSSFDANIRKWCIWSKIAFRSDLTMPMLGLYGDVEVVSRSDWNARRSIREFDTPHHKAEVVEILQTNTTCYERCAAKVRALQGEQLKRHSDIFANFIIGADGRIYEGLGWDWSRKDKVIYFDFLVKSADEIPWTQVLAAFSLQLREGVRLGKISENYTINIPYNNKKKLYNNIKDWGEWSRNIIKENVTVSFQTMNGETSTISRIDVDMPVSEKRVAYLEHPIDAVIFTQSSTSCVQPRNCVPYKRKYRGKSIRSNREIDSNFYFTSDGTVYEGLGWNRSMKGEKVIFEFLTASSTTLPSNQSMAASAFLVVEGVRNGKLCTNFKMMVGKYTTIDFENEVRKWDSWIRDAQDSWKIH